MDVNDYDGTKAALIAAVIADNKRNLDDFLEKMREFRHAVQTTDILPDEEWLVEQCFQCEAEATGIDMDNAPVCAEHGGNNGS